MPFHLEATPLPRTPSKQNPAAMHSCKMSVMNAMMRGFLMAIGRFDGPGAVSADEGAAIMGARGEKSGHNAVNNAIGYYEACGFWLAEYLAYCHQNGIAYEGLEMVNANQVLIFLQTGDAEVTKAIVSESVDYGEPVGDDDEGWMDSALDAAGSTALGSAVGMGAAAGEAAVDWLGDQFGLDL